MNASIDLLKIKITTKKMNTTLKEAEVLDLLGNEFPQINSEFEKMPDAFNIYKSISCFADYTKKLIGKGNLAEVKHCFNIAEKLLLEGNKTVKNAIENVYLFSMASILDFTNPVSHKIKGMLNPPLLTEYKKQLSTSGI